ncbi:hypothetical protein M0802_010390 [Mischocyttarus mexicanus]|nr:hypothetical protein M0802_010390 [Mischocyttarus mexicanus]
MVSLLSRLITSTTTFQRAKLFRSISILRYTQYRFNSSKVDKECVCPKSPDYVTRLAMPIDYDNVISFMCETYFRQEPSMINIGISEDPPKTSMMNLTLDLIKHGMTIIAENSDRYIVGAAINICSCPWDPKKMMEYARRCEEEGPMQDLIEFFAYVSSKPDVWNRYCVHKVFECSNVAVDPEYREMGIAKKLIEESWILARDCSYRLFRIDCSSRVAQQDTQVESELDAGSPRTN